MSLQKIVGGFHPSRLYVRIVDGLVALMRDLSVWSDVRAFPPLAVWAGVNCVAVMLLVRRLSDAASLKLTSTQVSITAVVAAILVVAARAMLARVERQAPVRWIRFMAALAAMTPIVTLFFGSARRLSLGTSAFLAAVALAAGIVVWLWNRAFIEQLLTSFLLPPPGAPTASGTTPVAPRIQDSGFGIQGNAARAILPPDPRPLTPESRILNPESCPPPDPHETLRLKRTTGRDGLDRLEGAMVAEFAGGQLTATLHIPFLPTFCRPPELVCQIDEQAAVRVKGTAVYPYGCRIELKRFGDVSAPLRVEVRFAATQGLPSSHAA